MAIKRGVGPKKALPTFPLSGRYRRLTPHSEKVAGTKISNGKQVLQIGIRYHLILVDLMNIEQKEMFSLKSLMM